MVDVIGHIGMALLVASLTWFAFDRRRALTFVLLAVPFGLLPDVDLYLRRWFPTIHHHGITHTLVFVIGTAAVAGLAVGRPVLSRLADRGWLGGVSRPATFATLAFITGGSSHLFADILSAPDLSQPIEPLWPVYRQVVALDVIYYNSTAWNVGLLLAGAVAAFGPWVWRWADVDQGARS